MSKWRLSWLREKLIKVYDSDLDGVIDSSAIPTGLFTVRREVLDEFSRPRVLIMTSSMKELLASGEVASTEGGTITADTETMTFTSPAGGDVGHTYLYWNLPHPATRVYAKATIGDVGNNDMNIDFCNGDGSTVSNPPDFYNMRVQNKSSYLKIELRKNVSGSYTTYASKNTGVWFKNYLKDLEFYCDVNNTLKVWWDNNLQLTATPDAGSISSIKSVRFRYYDANPDLTIESHAKGDVVIIYE